MLPDAKIMAFAPTRDFARARAFYEGTLGLPFLADDGFALTFDAHGTVLRVTKVPPFTPLPFTTLGWQVREVGQQVAALRDRGVVFERFPGLPQDDLGIWTAPGGVQVAWFKDPDGNLLSISSA